MYLVRLHCRMTHGYKILHWGFTVQNTKPINTQTGYCTRVLHNKDFGSSINRIDCARCAETESAQLVKQGATNKKKPQEGALTKG